MIVTQLKSENEILDLLKKYKSIFIIGCGSCAEQCNTGGESEVKIMAEFLKKQGKKITGWIVPDETCNIPLVKKELRTSVKEFDKADAVLIMACGAGVSTVGESVDKRVFPALDTVSLSNTLRIGSFEGKCSLCGECILGVTGGLCPVTICPKGMLNGPCGGTGDGKCEVNADNDCIWIKIYEKLDKFGALDRMKEITAPKKYSKIKRALKISTKPKKER